MLHLLAGHLGKPSSDIACGVFDKVGVVVLSVGLVEMGRYVSRGEIIEEYGHHYTKNINTPWP